MEYSPERVTRWHRPSPAMVVAILALLVSVSGNAAAAVIVSSNHQVATGTISGHNPPAGAHANIIGGSIEVADLSAGIKASLAPHCPNALVRGGPLCFDLQPKSQKAFFDALRACAGRFLRLPSPGELSLIFRYAGTAQSFQWSDSFYWDSNLSLEQAMAVSQNQNQVLSASNFNAAGSLPYRCVTDAT